MTVMHGMFGLAALGASTLCPLCDTGPRERSTDAPLPVVWSVDTVRVVFAVDGMTCGSCATTARIALQRVPGVVKAEVDYEARSATVLYESSRTSPAALAKRLKEMTGYEARVKADSTGRKGMP